MPITSKVDRVANLTIFTARGNITTEELKSSVKSFWESPSLTLNLIWDVRDASFTNITYKDVDEILFHANAYRARFTERKFGKTVIVVNSDQHFDILCGLTAYAKIQRLPIMPEVFKTMGEALAWIDQTESDLIASYTDD